MEDTTEELYIAADAELSESESRVAFDLLNAIYDQMAEQDKGKDEETNQPHVLIAEVFAKLIRIEHMLEGHKAVLSEAMEECEEASDAMLRAQDLVMALETVMRMINRIYYGSVDLVMTVTNNQPLFDACLVASKKLLAEYEEKTETNA